MATRFFSQEQMERLRSYPDIGREELVRFFMAANKETVRRHPKLAKAFARLAVAVEALFDSDG